MIAIQYFIILIKILLAKHQGYKDVMIVGKFYPKTIEKLKKKYKVKESEETLLLKGFIIIEWEENKDEKYRS